MGWVLIILIMTYGSNSTSIATSTATFLTEDLCNAAGKSAMELANDSKRLLRPIGVNYRCVRNYNEH